MLRHNSPKTAETSTKTIHSKYKNIESTLDNMLKNVSFSSKDIFAIYQQCSDTIILHNKKRMNIIFHISVGAGIIASISHLEMNQYKIGKVISGFTLGLISHGILDYTPHCYPINSKLDFFIGLSLILTIIYFIQKKYKILVSAILFGCVFPDIIDLLPGILNSQLNINLPTFENIFPWHIHEYSGSIYSEKCGVSNINHMLTIVFNGIVILLNKKNVIQILK
jgi:hypothetical protein